MKSTPNTPTATPDQPRTNGKKWVLFRQNYQSYRTNQIVELPDRIADQMIASGMARPWEQAQ